MKQLSLFKKRKEEVISEELLRTKDQLMKLRKSFFSRYDRLVIALTEIEELLNSLEEGEEENKIVEISMKAG